jgi:predicted permease
MFFHDLRHAARALRRTPIVALAAILSLGLGIGAPTLVFSWMDSLVLRPFPVIPDPQRLVGLNAAGPDGSRWPLSYLQFTEWRDHARQLGQVAAWTVTRLAVRQDTESGAMPGTVMLVSGNYFETLGIRSTLGRSLTVNDETGAVGAAVLSAPYWERQFARSPSVLGRTIYLNGQPVTVVGVAPERFAGTYVGVVPDLFVPLTLNPRLTGVHTLEDRSARWLQSVARLAPGIERGPAARQLDAIARRASTRAGDRPVVGGIMLLVREQFLGSIVFPLFSALLVITALLLLVACANVASLLLVRASARTQELAVRLSLGATPGRLTRLVVLESALLACAGAVVGLVIAWVGRGLLYVFAPGATFPISLPLTFSPRVALLAGVVAGATTLLCAMAAVRSTLRVAPAQTLRSSGRAVSAGSGRWRSSLVALQVAFSLCCLLTGALFVRSLRGALRIDPGFREPGQVLLVGTDFAAARLLDSAGVVALDRVLEQVRMIPGVVSASAASMVPLGFGGRRTVTIALEDRALAESDDATVDRSVVAPDYFATMMTRVVAGRPIGDMDRPESERVAVINQAFARRFWPGQDPIGRRIDAGRGWTRVVGVVQDGRYANLVDPPAPVAYFSARQWFVPALTLHVRAEGAPRQMVDAVTAALQSVHRDLQALQPRTLEEHASAATFVQRTGSAVLSVFGLVALVMATVGLYAALASTLAMRRREIAVRVALGASRGTVRMLVVSHALRICLTGMALGLLLALALGRFVGSRVPAIEPSDPVAIVGALAAVLIGAALACAAPLRRALGVSPAAALHE